MNGSIYSLVYNLPLILNYIFAQIEADVHYNFCGRATASENVTAGAGTACHDFQTVLHQTACLLQHDLKQNSHKFSSSGYSASLWQMEVEHTPRHQIITVSETKQTLGKKTLFPLHLS